MDYLLKGNWRTNCGVVAALLACLPQIYERLFVRTSAPIMVFVIRRHEHACAKHFGCLVYIISGVMAMQIVVCITNIKSFWTIKILWLILLDFDQFFSILSKTMLFIDTDWSILYVVIAVFIVFILLLSLCSAINRCFRTTKPRIRSKTQRYALLETQERELPARKSIPRNFPMFFL